MKRSCLLHDPPLEVENHKFGEHIDSHPDPELHRWPGGLDALEKELINAALER